MFPFVLRLCGLLYWLVDGEGGDLRPVGDGQGSSSGVQTYWWRFVGDLIV